MTRMEILAAAVKARLDITDERGASAVEYGLLVGTLAAFIIGAAQLLGGDLENTLGGLLD